MTNNQIEINLKVTGSETSNRAIKDLVDKLNQLGPSAEKMSKAFSTAFSDSTADKITKVSNSLNNLANVLGRISSNANVLNALSKIGMIGGAGFVGGGFGGGPVLDSQGNPVASSTSGGGGSVPPSGGTPGAPPTPDAGGIMGLLTKTFKAGTIAALPVTALQTITGTYDAFQYDLPIAVKNRELFGFQQLRRGDPSAVLAKERADSSVMNAIMAGGKTFGLAGAEIVGGGLAAALGGPVGWGIGGAAIFKGVKDLINSPADYQRARLGYAQKELEKDPYLKMLGEFNPQYADIIGNTEQLYGISETRDLMSRSVYGAANRASILNKMRQAGVSAVPGQVGQMEVSYARSGMGGVLDVALRHGIALNPALMHSQAAAAGLGGQGDIATREAISSIYGDVAGRSGILFNTEQRESDFTGRLFGFGGTAKALGVTGAENIARTAATAFEMQQGFGSNEIANMALRSKLAEKGIVGTEATALINSGIFTTKAGTAESASMLGKLGFNPREAKILSNLTTNVMGQMVGGLVSEEFTQKTGLTGANVLYQNENTAKAFRTALEGPVTAAGTKMELAPETSRQQIDRGAAGFENEMIKGVDAAMMVFKSKMDEIMTEQVSKFRDAVRKVRN